MIPHISVTHDSQYIRLPSGWSLFAVKIPDISIPEHLIIMCVSDVIVNNTFDKYVTWFYNLKDMGASSGHYFSDFKDALKDFNNRD